MSTITQNEAEIRLNKNQLMQLIEMTGLPVIAIEKLIDLQEAEKKEAEQRKKAKENPPFVQLYKGIGLKALQKLTQENQLASSIFIFFLENMNSRNIVMCSQQLLSEELQKGRTSIYTALKYLEEHKYINTAKIGTSNAYIINPEIAFQDSRNNVRYVSFDGTILLSKKENKELFNKYQYENLKMLKEK